MYPDVWTREPDKRFKLIVFKQKSGDLWGSMGKNM